MIRLQGGNTKRGVGAHWRQKHRKDPCPMQDSLWGCYAWGFERGLEGSESQGFQPGPRCLHLGEGWASRCWVKNTEYGPQTTTMRFALRMDWMTFWSWAGGFEAIVRKGGVCGQGEEAWRGMKRVIVERQGAEPDTCNGCMFFPQGRLPHNVLGSDASTNRPTTQYKYN